MRCPSMLRSPIRMTETVHDFKKVVGNGLLEQVVVHDLQSMTDLVLDVWTEAWFCWSAGRSLPRGGGQDLETGLVIINAHV